MSKKYYYADASEQVQGPFSLPELDALHKSGKVAANTQVCEEGTENWTQLFLVPRLASPKQKLPDVVVEAPKELQAKSTSKHNKSEFKGITKSQGSILIALLLIGSGAPFWVFLKPVPKWEYTIIAPSDSAFESVMNEHGSNGWELISTRRASDSDSKMSYECILKRPKR
jgi:hypothetical protein